MIYVGEVYSSQGRAAGPLYGTKETVVYSLMALEEYIIKDFDDSVSELRCQNIITYEFKRLQAFVKRLFDFNGWHLYIQESKTRKTLRKRRRVRVRTGQE